MLPRFKPLNPDCQASVINLGMTWLIAYHEPSSRYRSCSAWSSSQAPSTSLPETLTAPPSAAGRNLCLRSSSSNLAQIARSSSSLDRPPTTFSLGDLSLEGAFQRPEGCCADVIAAGSSDLSCVTRFCGITYFEGVSLFGADVASHGAFRRLGRGSTLEAFGLSRCARVSFCSSKMSEGRTVRP